MKRLCRKLSKKDKINKIAVVMGIVTILNSTVIPASTTLAAENDVQELEPTEAQEMGANVVTKTILENEKNIGAKAGFVVTQGIDYYEFQAQLIKYLYPGYNTTGWTIFKSTGSINLNVPGEYLLNVQVYTPAGLQPWIYVNVEVIAAEGAPVTVRYVDENGNPLAEAEILTGKLGTDYQTEAKEIEGYILTEIPSNATGIFTNQEQTVTYVYEEENYSEIDAENPEVEIPTVDIDKENPEAEIPTVDIDKENPEAEIPTVDIDKENPEVEIPTVDIDKENPEVEIPTVDIDKENPEVEIPEVEIDVETPKVELSEGEIDAENQKVEIPEVNIDAETSKVEENPRIEENRQEGSNSDKEETDTETTAVKTLPQSSEGTTTMWLGALLAMLGTVLGFKRKKATK